jgi:hypothetical protein
MTNKHERDCLSLHMLRSFDVAIARQEVFNSPGCAVVSTIVHRPPERPERPNDSTTPRLPQGVTDGAKYQDGEFGPVNGELPLPRVRLFQ